MKYTSIDKIVRGVLLQRRWPMHFYVECVAYAQRCFEELHFDTLGNVRTALLPITNYSAAVLPCDYLDYCKIGIVCNQQIRPLSAGSGYNRLNNFDAVGNKIPYPSDDDYLSGLFGFGYYTWFNDKMEATGGNYGSKGNLTQTFKVIKERNEIQLNNCLDATDVILEYISDGSECDNATKITPYAKATIEAYILWKYKENSRSYSEYERERAKQEYINQHRMLRGRQSKLTASDIKAIFRRNAHGSIKG